MWQFRGGDPADRTSWKRVRSTADTTAKLSTSDRLRGAVRMGIHGLSQGSSDEIAGGLSALRGDGYESGRDDARDRIDQIRSEMPKTALAAEMVGGAALPIGGGAAVGTRIAARTGSRLLGGLAGGAAGGGLGGAVTGLMEGEDAAGRAMGAIGGGAVGFALGGVLGGAGAAAGRRFAKGTHAATRAASRVNDVLYDAGVRMDGLGDALERIGPGSVPADLGANVGREARAAVNQASSLSRPGGPVSRIQARAAERGDRMADELVDAAGFRGMPMARSLQLAGEARDEVRRVHYAPLEARYPAVSSKKIMAAADGRLPAGHKPSFAELQDALMDLRDDATEAAQSGRPYASQKAMEKYDRLRNAMAEELDGFAEAQTRYMHASKRVEAHDMGRSMANKNPREIQEAMSELPDEASRDAFRRGVLDRKEDTLRRTESGGAEMSKLLSPGSRTDETLQILMGSDEGYARVLKGSERENRWAATWAALSGNSTSAQQINDVFTMMPKSKAQLFTRLIEMVAGDTDAERVRTAELIGNALLTEGDDAARELARRLSQAPQRAAPVGAAIGAAAAQVPLRGGLLSPSPEAGTRERPISLMGTYNK